MSILTQASRQWASRPDDERFTNLLEMDAAVQATRSMSRERIIGSRHLQIAPAAGDETKGLQVHSAKGVANLTHWSFGQLAGLAGAPAGYLRKLPAPIAADALNYGMRFERQAEDVGCLLQQTDQGPTLKAATGPRYGRVWNSDITTALVDRFGDGLTGDFRVPGEFGKEVRVTKQNTTLYASDRDMFVFLADEVNRIEMPNRRDGKSGSLARGFFLWNSEVGSQSMGAAFFLFDYACSNRIVWGAQGFKEIRIRHTASAPDKWLEEVSPVLMEYAQAAAQPVEDTIKAAQAKKLDGDLDAFLAKRFTKSQAVGIKAAHEEEEGRPMETLWDVTTGVTAFAKSIKWQDERVAMERAGGAILDLVAA